MIGRALTYSTDIEPGPAIGREGVAFVADTLTVLALLSPSGSLACHALIQLTETTARAIRAKADQIVGLGTAGETPPSSIRSVARVKRAAERARDRMAAEINAARRDPYQRAADDEAIRRAQAAKAAEAYAHRREVEALMRPGGRHG